MKKISIVMILVLLILTFSGCKSKNNSSDTMSTENEASSTTSNEFSSIESVNTDSSNESSSKEEASKTESSSKKETTSNSSSSKNNQSSFIPSYKNPTSGGEADEEMKIVKAEISAVYPSINQKITLANDKVLKLSENYVIKGSKEYYGGGNIYKPNAIEFKWTCDKNADSYILTIGTDKNLKNADEYQAPNTKSFSLLNLCTGKTYYWQVTAKFANGIAKSKIFTFQTAQTVRTIYIEGVSNTRDIGGYLTESGKRVKQDMVYRAASLDGINIAGKGAALYSYKIKTDLDLRGKNEGSSGTRSPIDANVNYIHTPGAHYWSGISNKENWTNLAKAIEAFANPDNYPIIVHCSVGRDRTGTLCLLLNGLLGVSKEDLFLDYELSFLSQSGCADGASVSSMVNTFETMYNNLAVYGGEDGKPFSAHVEKFLLDIGVSQKNINAIKSNMLEEAK